MASRKGSLLETQVEDIFSTAGFDVKTNEYVAGYEIDVHAFLGDIQIVVECKQYEQSRLSVRNLIHQWVGKNDAIKADRIILVIYGQEISDEERDLASQQGLVVWDEEMIADLIRMDEDDVREAVLDSIAVEERDLAKKHDRTIRKLVWQPLLANETPKDDTAYQELLYLVKQRIRRRLFQQGTTKAERQNHISFFEQGETPGSTKTKGTSESEIFEDLQSQLESGNDPFGADQSETYEAYLNSVREAYVSTKDYYLNSEGKEKLDRLIQARVHDVYHSGDSASLAELNDGEPVNVEKDGSMLAISLELESDTDLEIIRWILMREGDYTTEEITDDQGNVTGEQTTVFFEYKAPEECADAVFRVFDEYFENSVATMSLIDLNYTDAEEADSACFIATAAYGTALHQDLDILRTFRDQTLASSAVGRLFTRTYYRTSPPIAALIKKSPTLQKAVRASLKPVVRYLDDDK